MGYNIQGYTFATLDEANAAISTINEGEGIPKAAGKTTTYAVPQQLNGYYYIYADDVTRQYLTGETTITLPDPVLICD